MTAAVLQLDDDLLFSRFRHRTIFLEGLDSDTAPAMYVLQELYAAPVEA